VFCDFFIFPPPKKKKHKKKNIKATTLQNFLAMPPRSRSRGRSRSRSRSQSRSTKRKTPKTQKKKKVATKKKQKSSRKQTTKNNNKKKNEKTTQQKQRTRKQMFTPLIDTHTDESSEDLSAALSVITTEESTTQQQRHHKHHSRRSITPANNDCPQVESSFFTLPRPQKLVVVKQREPAPVPPRPHAVVQKPQRMQVLVVEDTTRKQALQDVQKSFADLSSQTGGLQKKISELNGELENIKQAYRDLLLSREREILQLQENCQERVAKESQDLQKERREFAETTGNNGDYYDTKMLEDLLRIDRALSEMHNHELDKDTRAQVNYLTAQHQQLLNVMAQPHTRPTSPPPHEPKRPPKKPPQRQTPKQANVFAKFAPGIETRSGFGYGKLEDQVFLRKEKGEKFVNVQYRVDPVNILPAGEKRIK
jgi:hypothetical protein